MGSLIDADKLKADLEKAISKNEDMDCLDFLRIASVIDKQPTAYDRKGCEAVGRLHIRHGRFTYGKKVQDGLTKVQSKL